MEIKNISKKVFSGLFFVSAITYVNAQAPDRGDWYNLDYEKDKVRGVSVDKAYTEIIKNKKGNTVVVAVIDSGVEVDHDDLKEVMWTNPKEIAGDQKDNDNNLYVDDIHGWNFLGNADGQNIGGDNLEVTRLYAALKPRFENIKEEDIKKKDAADYTTWLKVKEEVETKRQQSEGAFASMEFQVNMVTNAMQAVGQEMSGKAFTKENIESIPEEDQMLSIGKKILLGIIEEGVEINSIEEVNEMISEQIGEGFKYYENQLKYHYNPDLDTRKIIGDNYADAYEKGYGNNDYEGPDAGHGTHVAGIIAASRGNNIGIDGVCATCKIMTIRAVPDGDERDKDVANAIIYAVDNGAKVINMSFGKGYSWDKKAVDKAVMYAAKNDVLLVHAAGNSSQNNDIEPNFPNPNYEKDSRSFFSKIFGGKKSADNWLEIGASTYHNDEKLVASFSNYGKNRVDVFAPGFQINSTIPGNIYGKFSGTSMAAPVVAGIAGVIRSYYPALSAKQVKEIIMDSAVKIDSEVRKPGDTETVAFNTLSRTGGVANLYTALQLAEERSK